MDETADAELLRTLLDATVDGIALADERGELAYANRPFRTLAETLGLALDGPFTERLLELADRTSEPYAFTAAVERLRDGGGSVEFEDAALAAVFLLVAAPLAHGTGTALTLRELTHDRDRERRRQEHVDTIGHELRTPLTSMSGFLGLLADGETGPLNPEQRRYLEIVQRANDRLQQLVDELLAAPGRELKGAR